MNTRLQADPDYRQVKVRAFGPFSSASYWLGPDHLLIVILDGYREHYRRIGYRDVQCLLMRRTGGWIAVSVIALFLFLVLGILPLTTGETAGYWMGGINLALWGGVLAVNLLQGPTARCQVWTAVQRHDLPSLGRWRQMERLIDVLLPEIERMQPVEPRTMEASGEVDREPDDRRAEPGTEPIA